MGDDRKLSELIEDIVDKGATTAEEIHQAIADLPLNVLERLELFEQTTSEVRKVQHHSIGAIYDLIRDVNHKVADLSTDLLDQRGSGKKRAKKGKSTAKKSPASAKKARASAKKGKTTKKKS